MPVDAAVAEIQRFFDAHFDREVADAFLRVLSRNGGSLLMAEAELSSHVSAADATRDPTSTEAAADAAGPSAKPRS